MIRRAFIVFLGSVGGTLFCRGEDKADIAALAEARIRDIGGYVARKEGAGAVVNVSLNGNASADDALMGDVAVFEHLTDLSLEGTLVGDAGIEALSTLIRIEWLNLYQTRVSDRALKTIGTFGRLEQLPIGETKITDAGLVHLRGLKSLHYLGLRGTAVTDTGVATVAGFPALRSLHLGETDITDTGIAAIADMALVQLWLHDTQVSKAAVPALKKLKTLRKLWIADTRLAADRAAVLELQRALPKCRIIE